jgi:hypothetical protein
MAQSAAAAAAAKRNSETARRSGPGLDVSFVLTAFGSYRFVKRGASKSFCLPLTHFLRVGLFEPALFSLGCEMPSFCIPNLLFQLDTLLCLN